MLSSKCGLWLFLCVFLKLNHCQEEEELTDEEQGVVDEEDTGYNETIEKMILTGVIEYYNEEAKEKEYHNIAPDLEMRTVWKPKDCVGPASDNDQVQVEYYRVLANKNTLDSSAQESQEPQKIQAIVGVERNVHVWLEGMCLGERRRLAVAPEVREKFRHIFPKMGKQPIMEFEVELHRINLMHWETFKSGLQLAMMEPVQDEYCARTVIYGDTLAVEYEGSLEDGTVFDSSAARKSPFGPFVQGHGQIIRGYEEALEERCLGERFRMIVPPHLAYGDQGAGDLIPPGATLIFDVRLVLLNEAEWKGKGSEDRVLAWETTFLPKDCQKKAEVGDDISIHYHATREDRSTFGSLVDGEKPYGPFILGDKGTMIPALDRAIPGMCLGERRRVSVPPRMGWYGTQHDTIVVELDLLWMNGYQAEETDGAVPFPQGPPSGKDEL